MITGYITHEEAMIQDFINNSKYAEELLREVLLDGDDYEKQRVQEWYDEAQKRKHLEKTAETSKQL